jgi:hypothetical protein
MIFMDIGLCEFLHSNPLSFLSDNLAGLSYMARSHLMLKTSGLAAL